MRIIALLKNLIGYTLVVALLAPIVMRDVVLIHFYLNRDRIAKELCVEKENAKSCCKGTCQLNKELGKVTEETSQDQLPATGEIEILWEHCFAEFHCPHDVVSTSIMPESYLEMQSCSDLQAAERPPCC